MSTSIVQHSAQYSPLGIVFVILSWLVAFSIMMLGGAAADAVLYERRHGAG
ncbi:MAG: hypothetical protein L0I24_16725 [Pseudonocardia sp.]|nr:hypothetical protein [Pseudonocardia sp.]